MKPRTRSPIHTTPQKPPKNSNTLLSYLSSPFTSITNIIRSVSPWSTPNVPTTSNNHHHQPSVSHNDASEEGEVEEVDQNQEEVAELFRCPHCSKEYQRKGHYVRHVQGHAQGSSSKVNKPKVGRVEKAKVSSKGKTAKAKVSEATVKKTVGARKAKTVVPKEVKAKKTKPVPKTNKTAERIHAAESPFQCHTCKASFTVKGNLTRHVLNKHSK